MQPLKGSILIDDSYNSNPASLRNALDSIDEQEKLCILGEMKELGPIHKGYQCMNTQVKG